VFTKITARASLARRGAGSLSRNFLLWMEWKANDGESKKIQTESNSIHLSRISLELFGLFVVLTAQDLVGQVFIAMLSDQVQELMEEFGKRRRFSREYCLWVERSVNHSSPWKGVLRWLILDGAW
jgi:hypothetical protein